MRYSRQEAIKGWQQDKIANTGVCLIGSSITADFAAVDLVSLGFGNVTRLSHCEERLEFQKMNPECNYEQRCDDVATIFHAKMVIAESNIVVAASQSREENEFFFRAAKDMGRNYYSLSSGNEVSSFRRNTPVDFARGENMAGAMIASAVCIDEARKDIFMLKDDIKNDYFRFETTPLLSFPKRVIQVGAGAIGTFIAYAIAGLGCEATILDFDNIEESNLNRQFMFYDSIGRNKAEVLAERLRTINPNIRGINSKIDINFNPIGFDAVISAVDNDKARYFMSEACKKYAINLFNGGSSVFGAQAMPYIDGKTACLDCQIGGLKEKVNEEPAKRGNLCFHPSNIISNQIAAGMMVECMAKSVRGEYNEYRYSSGMALRRRVH